MRRGPQFSLALGSWQAPRFYVYQAGEMPGIRKELLYIKEPVWGPAAVQVGPAPVFFAKFLELQANSTNTAPLSGRRSIEVGAGKLIRLVVVASGSTPHDILERMGVRSWR